MSSTPWEMSKQTFMDSWHEGQGDSTEHFASVYEDGEPGHPDATLTKEP